MLDGGDGEPEPSPSPSPYFPGAVRPRISVAVSLAIMESAQPRIAPLTPSWVQTDYGRGWRMVQWQKMGVFCGFFEWW